MTSDPPKDRVKQFFACCYSHSIISRLVIIGIIVIAVAAFSGAASNIATFCRNIFSEKAIEQDVIVVINGTWHVGDDNRPDYPEAIHGGKTELDFPFTIPKTPKSVNFIVEVYDMDNITANVFLNGRAFGQFAPGHGWHKQYFSVPEGMARKGHNTLRVKSKEWSKNQVEDFLMKNGHIIVEY